MYMILIVISAFAAYRLYGSGLFIVALINALANFWSLGVMVNFRGEAWPQNNYDRFVGAVAILTTIAGIVLLIMSFTSK